MKIILIKVSQDWKENNMTTKAKHAQRSRRNHMIYFQSKDKAKHELDEWKNPIYKDHPKKYDGKGNRIVEGEE